MENVVKDDALVLSQAGQEKMFFEIQQRKAQALMSASLIPSSYKNIGDCMIAIDMANRMNANPLMIMQNLYIVHGVPSFSSKFLIACINASKKFSPLRYEYKGKENTDEWACRAYAYEIDDKEHKEPLYGDWVSIDMAKKEGWYEKIDNKGNNKSKWATMPSLMMKYRASAFWQRVYCPEISMGFISTEEAYEIQDVAYEEVSARKSLAEIAKSAVIKEEKEEVEERPEQATTSVNPTLFEDGAED